MVDLYKYPRTPHLPFSKCATSDDKFATKDCLDTLKSGVELVVTEKMDGGNLTFYRDYYHARSLSSGTHAWDTAAKSLWASVRFDIPEGYRISGESMYAQRSVAYDNLDGVFLVFGVWDDSNNLLSWDETEEWCDLLELPHVPVIYRGDSFDDAIKAWDLKYDEEISEGFVVRNAASFHFDEFSSHIAKFVRADHVRTTADWRNRDDFSVNGFVDLGKV